jgi:hypothetical protein
MACRQQQKKTAAVAMRLPLFFYGVLRFQQIADSRY